MKSQFYFIYILVLCVFINFSCQDFLEKVPLDSVSQETYWTSYEQAEIWVNNLYRVEESSTKGLQGVHITTQEAFSDNAFGRATARGANNIANGLFDENDANVRDAWDYTNIRLCLEFFEFVERVPDLTDEQFNLLAGQVRFLLAHEYYKLITRFRDVPLVTHPLDIDESDIPVSSKEEVLAYILQNLDDAISLLPVTWPEEDKGRASKGAALFLKTRVLLYNERFEEAAATAKQVIDLNVYQLQPNFEELFLPEFNNKKDETILEIQYIENIHTHFLSLRFSPVMFNAHAVIQPTPQLVDAFQMKDGLSIEESPLYDPKHPFDNRDPRFYDTFLWHGQELNETYPPLDLTGSEFNFSRTYVYFKKGIVGFRDRFRPMHLNWNLFRYADLLLMYAEAKNEASGPDESVYEVLDQIRERAGMPAVDRNKYGDQASLRSFIRNERRVELAGEGLRYNDIIRWRIAEDVLNIELTSMDLMEWVDNPVDESGNQILTVRPVETRQFDPNKHYVWPIPQFAIDRADNLTQNPEWQ